MMLIKKIRFAKSEAGFTFIELMVVISLIAIISAIAYPPFLSMRARYRLKAVAREVFTVLQVNKMRAVKESSITAVIFNQASASYQVCFSRGASDWADPSDNICNDTIVLDPAVRMTRGNAPLRAPKDTLSYDDLTYSSGIAGFFQDGTGFEGNQTRISGARYVYISSLNSPEVYAIGTNRVGLVQLYVWTGGASWK